MDSEWTQNSLGIWSEFGQNLVGMGISPKAPTISGKLTGMTRSVPARQFVWKRLKSLTLR